MRRLLLLLALAATCGVGLALAGPASAHPLGNFTVNHYAGIELAGDRVYLRFVLDLAEIPSFQEGATVRRPGYAAEIARALELSVDGRPARLVPVAHRTTGRPGAGGLTTIRFEAVYSAPARGKALTFSDRSFPSRIGWREITVVARDGATLVRSSVPATSSSRELRAYPRELLRSPLDVRAARVTFLPGTAAADAPVLGEASAPPRVSGGFESLIARGDLSIGVILLSLAIAAFWGATHALTPGHGKAIVAGYLVGTRGRPRHAFLLGATVTITHTAGVFALGLVTLLLSRFVVPERLYPWLTLVSGLLVVAVGAAVLRQRSRSGGSAEHAHDEGAHDHHHHRHDADALASRGIVGVGIAAGLLPCPSALVVLLSAIALHRVGFGFALIAAFSLGLAATITAVGLVAVLARRAFGGVSLEGRLVRALPAASALVILAVGLVLTAKAIPGVV